MENFEEVNNGFNTKKSNKKGLIIGGVIALVIIVALIVAYMLTLGNPKFIFSKTLDKLLDAKIENYDSIKLDTETKISVKMEDESYSEASEILEEVGKCSLKLGSQVDFENEKEIVNVGLKYDKESVADAQIYYDDGNMYAYFNEIYDKYISLELEKEQQEQLKELFETLQEAKEQNKNTEKAIKIFKEELKQQVKQNGTFEKGKETVAIDGKDVKVTKTVITLTEKDTVNIMKNICSNLAANDKFLDCFKESPKDLLKEMAKELKDVSTSSKNKMTISIYTKGLLADFVGACGEIYIDDEELTISVTVLKEGKGVYTLSAKTKEYKTKTDILNAKIEINKEKDNKNEKEGNLAITIEIPETAKIKLEVSYSMILNEGIDKINVKNSVKAEDISESDIEAILEKLYERPLIGDLIKEKLETNNNLTGSTNTYITTSENEVKDDYYGYSIKYSVPAGFEYESNYSYDYTKYYKLEEDNSEIEAKVSIEWDTEEDYKEDIDWDYNYYNDDTYYKNVNLGDIKAVKVGDSEFKYQILSYESNSEYYNEKYQKAYLWYNLDDEYIFSIELESTDKDITEDIIKGFLNINVNEI